MRVLVIAQLFPPDMGGGATRAYNVVKGLNSAGCDVTVVAGVPHYPDGEIRKKYRWKPLVIEHPGKFKLIRTFVPPLKSKGFVRRIILSFSFLLSSLFALPVVRKPDVVWASNPNIIGVFPAIIYKLVKRCKIAQNVDDLWPEEIYDLGMLKSTTLRRFAEFVSKTIYRISSIITPISPSYAKVISEKYQANPKKIHVIPAGVDMRYFKKHSPALQSSDHRAFKVLYIGAMSVCYDFHQVLKAAKLLDKYTEIVFIIQGGGELAPVIKREVSEMDLNNVQVVEKVISREEVAQVLGEADVLLLPLSNLTSVEMGISSKLYEYQAAGKPIVACSGGQPGQYVQDTKSGIVIQPGDHEALAKTILHLKENPKVAKELGSSGRGFVENNLSLEKIGLKMRKLFEAVV